MKIVQIITGLYPAGAERITADLCKGLKDRGHEVEVISLQPLPESSCIIDELQNHQINIHSLNISQSTPWNVFRLSGVLKKIDPDIVHAHLIHANLVSRIFPWKRNFLLVNTVHIAERRVNKWWHFFFDRLSYKRCDIQTAVSKAVRDYHTSKLGIRSDEMPVIYNGITPPETLTQNQISELRKEWGMEDCGRIIGSVGRLDRQKGYDLLMSLMPELWSEMPREEQWGIVILGDGIEKTILQQMAKNAPDTIKIVMPGYRSDASRCIGAFDLFVMPSRYEGFGLTMVEAMGHGVAILASDVDSLPELLNGYANGECIDFKNKQLVAEKIVEYVRLPKHAPENKYDISRMVDGYLSIYNS